MYYILSARLTKFLKDILSLDPDCCTLFILKLNTSCFSMIAYIPICSVGNNIFLHYHHYFQILWNQCNNFRFFIYSTQIIAIIIFHYIFPMFSACIMFLFSMRKMLTTFSYFCTLYFGDLFYFVSISLLNILFHFFPLMLGFLRTYLRCSLDRVWLINDLFLSEEQWQDVTSILHLHELHYERKRS